MSENQLVRLNCRMIGAFCLLFAASCSEDGRHADTSTKVVYVISTLVWLYFAYRAWRREIITPGEGIE